MPIPHKQITAVVLAGGQSRRMQGKDKGLITINNKMMIAYVLEVLSQQVDTIYISANRNLQHYQSLGHPVVTDQLSGYQGPLAGIASVMENISTPLLLCVPCDSPLITPQLTERLYTTLKDPHYDLSVAHDGIRLQPAFCLLRSSLHSDLQAYLQGGGRKIDTWFDQHRYGITDFSDQPQIFLNINRPEDKQHMESSL